MLIILKDKYKQDIANNRRKNYNKGIIIDEIQWFYKEQPVKAKNRQTDIEKSTLVGLTWVRSVVSER